MGGGGGGGAGAGAGGCCGQRRNRKYMIICNRIKTKKALSCC